MPLADKRKAFTRMANNLRKIWDADPDAAPRESTYTDDTVGRFRSGRLVGDTPEALNEWRVTTGDPVVADRVSALMGGTPAEWATENEDNIEVLTDSPSVRIIIEPDGVDASFKLFMPGAGLVHHCDGFEFLSPDEEKGKTCGCPSFIAERKMRAQQKRGPSPSVEITFSMEEAPELGKFRFNSGSWKLVEALGPIFADLDRYGNTSIDEPGKPVRATLTIENVTYVPKKGPRAGQTVSYNVPRVKVLGPVEVANEFDEAMAA